MNKDIATDAAIVEEFHLAKKFEEVAIALYPLQKPIATSEKPTDNEDDLPQSRK